MQPSYIDLRKEELKHLEEFCARVVCNAHTYLTGAEAERLWTLRRKLKVRYDAVNRQWFPLDEEDLIP